MIIDPKTLNAKKKKKNLELHIKNPTEAKALIIRYLLDMVNYLILFLLLNNVSWKLERLQIPVRPEMICKNAQYSTNISESLRVKLANNLPWLCGFPNKKKDH